MLPHGVFVTPTGVGAAAGPADRAAGEAAAWLALGVGVAAGEVVESAAAPVVAGDGGPGDEAGDDVGPLPVHPAIAKTTASAASGRTADRMAAS
jgi:hypothetical protein